MHVNDDDQFMLARLEEKVLNVGKQDVDALATMTVSIAQTILMHFNTSRDTFAIESWAHENHVKNIRFAVFQMLVDRKE